MRGMKCGDDDDTIGGTENDNNNNTFEESLTTYDDFHTNSMVQSNCGKLHPDKEVGQNSVDNKEEMTLQNAVKQHVLCFLPAKSLCRFRLVCKDWNHWITQPFLAHLHSYNYQDISGIFCQTLSERPFFISLDHSACGVQSSALSFLPESVFIRAASHGLLCCQSIFTHNPRYYICNPATKEWKKLPKPKFYHWQNSAAVALNFHPSVFNFKASFELVCAVAVPENHVVCFEIYSSRSGSWRISGTECYEEDAWKLKGDGFCLNGVAFWETCCGTILAFYLSDEEYGMLITPPTTGSSSLSSSSQGFLTQMNGELCYFVVHENIDGLRIDIHGGWDMSFKYRISLDSSTPSQTNGELRVLPCVNGEVVMVISKRGFLGAYKVKDRKMKLSGISYGHDNSITSDEYVKCLPYVNSLVSIGSQIVESQDFYH